MNIGVLTSSGEMYLLKTSLKLDNEFIEEFVCKTVLEDAGNLNWQVLEESPDGTLKFRIVEV